MPICYDCKTETSDFVMERRQTSGGGHGDLYDHVYPGDFSDVPVHANRRECQKAREQKHIAELRAKDPFYDVPAR